VIARAEGEAERFSKLLTEYQGAKGVTRDRLYIDAMESVLGNTSKIMVDVEGNNLMMLPLDRMQQAGAAAMATPRKEDVVQELADEIRNLNDRADADRTRTVR
jgi:membrane protease subunit HflK